MLLLDGLSMAISGYKTPAHPLIFYGGLWRPGLIIALGGTKSPKILCSICTSKLFKQAWNSTVFFNVNVNTNTMYYMLNYLGLPLFLLKDICVLNYKNYNENWAPNHCEKMLIWFLCINFALAKIRKGVQKLASFVRPFFMSVPKAQPLRFNTFLRLEQNPRSSSGNHHQWCRALNLCYHILVIFFQSFSWPQFIALIYMKATCRDSWAPHRPHWYVEWWG